MAEISIIVPVYKVERYLDRCVISILKQTFTDFELILVDDGSPDQCPRMCDEWGKRDHRIRVIHQENGGLSSARNKGLEIHKGKYVFFVDSDDWLEKDAISILYQIAVCTEADIVIGGICRERNFRMCDRRYEMDNIQYKVYDRNAYLDMYLKITKQDTKYYACAKLYSAKAASYICYPEGYTAEDVLGTFCAIANANKIVETSYIIYHYFINEAGITKRPLNRDYLDMYYCWNKVIAYSQDQLPEYVEKCQYNLKRIDLPILLSFMVRPVSSAYREYLSDIRMVKCQLNKNYTDLMKGPLPVAKKIILTLCWILPTGFFCVIGKIKCGQSIWK